DRLRARVCDGPRTLDRVDADLIDFPHLGAIDLFAAGADDVAVEEAVALVLLPFPHDDAACEIDLVEGAAHGLGGGAVGLLLLTGADPRRRGDRGGLGHTNEIHAQLLHQALPAVSTARRGGPR